PWLGTQTSVQFCTLTGGGCYQTFQGGWLVKSSAGSYAIPATVVALWQGWGRDAGILGYPTGAPSNATGDYTQRFQGGLITVSGGVATLTSVSDPWFNARLSSPWLGTQTSVQFCT